MVTRGDKQRKQIAAHGWLTLMPSRSTTLTPSDRMDSSRLATPSSRRLISSTYLNGVWVNDGAYGGCVMVYR
jgi:hypothetical protein